MKTFLVLFLVVIPMLCWAVPQQINYQGFLASTDGTPLDTAVVVTFKLYNLPSGGSPVWTQTQNPCSVRAGKPTGAILSHSIDSGPAQA